MFKLKNPKNTTLIRDFVQICGGTASFKFLLSTRNVYVSKPTICLWQQFGNIPQKYYREIKNFPDHFPAFFQTLDAKRIHNETLIVMRDGLKARSRENLERYHTVEELADAKRKAALKQLMDEEQQS